LQDKPPPQQKLQDSHSPDQNMADASGGSKRSAEEVSQSCEFSGKVAIVTGSTSGIGESVAKTLASKGFSVVVTGSRSTDVGEALASDLGNDSIFVQADVTKDGECRGLIDKTLAKYERLDLLVNNAGMNMGKILHDDLEAIDDAKMRQLFDLNVFGVLYTSRAAMPALKKAGGGCIINITSSAGIRPGGSSIPYSMSKAAVNHVSYAVPVANSISSITVW
jgi:ketoreductase RED2